MGVLGRWLGSWPGDWFGADSGGPPGPHSIGARGIRYAASVGRPTVGRVQGHGGWETRREDYIPPPHRIRPRPFYAGPTFGVPAIQLQAAASPVRAAPGVGRPQLRARPVRSMVAPAVQPVGRYAAARREDEEMML